MKWRFKGFFSERVGKDYNYECDNCGYKIQVRDIPDIPAKEIGRDFFQFFCPKCDQLEEW